MLYICANSSLYHNSYHFDFEVLYHNKDLHDVFINYEHYHSLNYFHNQKHISKAEFKARNELFDLVLARKHNMTKHLWVIGKTSFPIWPPIS